MESFNKRCGEAETRISKVEDKFLEIVKQKEQEQGGGEGEE